MDTEKRLEVFASSPHYQELVAAYQAWFAVADRRSPQAVACAVTFRALLTTCCVEQGWSPLS